MATIFVILFPKCKKCYLGGVPGLMDPAGSLSRGTHHALPWPPNPAPLNNEPSGTPLGRKFCYYERKIDRSDSPSGWGGAGVSRGAAELTDLTEHGLGR